MTGDELTCEQVERISESLRPSLAYLSRLLTQMEQEFPADDPLLERVRVAKNAMQDLAMALHYQGCSGVGPPPKSAMPEASAADGNGFDTSRAAAPLIES